VTVELFTQIAADGTTTRRIEYRLERVDTEKGDARVAFRGEESPLRLFRLPAGDGWMVRETSETGLSVVSAEAVFASPDAVGGDFFRARTERSQPARNVVSAFVDTKHGVYEWQEVLRDPTSPLAVARALSRTAVRRDGEFTERFAAALAGKGAGPRESDVRRAFRDELAEPFAREVAAIGERPLYGPRERRDLEALYDALDAKQRALAERLSELAPGTPAEEIEAATKTAFEATAEALVAELEKQGLPFFIPDFETKLRFRATLVMPGPILRANTCVAGETAVWEFEEEDLFGRGFEMKATAALP
jgi:hypothetical protein